MNNLQSALQKKELVEIHQGFLQKLARRQAQQQSSRLRELQQRRIALQVKIAETKQTHTSGRLVAQDESSYETDRPYLRMWHPEVVDSDKADPSIPLAQRLQEVRQQRTLAAAYRLAGISLLPCVSKEVLALRFDISWQGRFVACYHCFLDAVSTASRRRSRQNPAQELYLRLVQHTLPRSIPLARIWQKHMGGMVSVGPLTEPDQWRVDWMEPLRAFAQELYRACYRDWVHQQIIHTIRQHWDPKMTVIKHEDDTQQFNFHIASRLRVRLDFQAMSDRPSGIVVRWIHTRKQRKHPSSLLRHHSDILAISDDEDEDNPKIQQQNDNMDKKIDRENVLNEAKEFFRRLPVLEAIPQVSKLITSQMEA
ncbi:hypothetical protein FisN_4Lu443 [Fistulifera solaris]|uniref:Uncharacterized protein n=1 Tax=Fistulifera solaris TaxID=1519565 RepID=A0A1Z5JZ90_FISSO|nr:hypothetical protein FisN_4Lu443 [Fistulifera solaris]|eukprot:GAX19353.1 hypothetical protein FisN_4Lu443 [Fistulifera solaris]